MIPETYYRTTMDPKKITSVLILSECHKSEVHWTPEYGSKAYRQSTPLRAKAIDRPKEPQPKAEDVYVKPKRWTKKEAKALRAWRKDSSPTHDRGGFRPANTVNANR